MFVTVARALFTAAVVLLLLGGLAIVAGQLVGLVAGQGAWLAAVADTLEPPTFAAASVAGLLAFVLSYLREPALVGETTRQPAVVD